MPYPVFIDFEYDTTPDRPLSLGLYQGDIVDQKQAYVVFHDHLGGVQDPWVKENVIPHLNKPLGPKVKRYDIDIKDIGTVFDEYFKDNRSPVIVADFGLDIAMFAKLTIGKDHRTYDVFKSIIYQHRRIDAYPALISGLVQHHALDDAIALHDAFSFITMNHNQLFRWNPETGVLWIKPSASSENPQMRNYYFCEMMQYVTKASSISVVNKYDTFDFYDIGTTNFAERLDLIKNIFHEYGTGHN